MKRDTANYVLVGGFVLAMAAALAVLLVAVGGRSGSADSYFVYYRNVTGLGVGTAVLYEGYRVGQIEGITPEHTATGMQYRVEFSVKSDWRIPTDSVAQVASSGLISAVTIQIAEGQASTYLKPGDSVLGREQSDIFAVLNRAAGDFQTLSKDGLMPVLTNINQRVNQLSDEMVAFRRDDLSPLVAMLHQRIDQDLVAETVELINHLDESAIGLKALVDEDNQTQVHSFLTSITAAASNLYDLIARIESTRQQMDGVLVALGSLASDNQAQVKGTMVAAETSMQELELALKTVNQQLASILHNVEGSTRHMSEFARIIRQNPSRLIRSSTAEQPGQQ